MGIRVAVLTWGLHPRPPGRQRRSAALPPPPAPGPPRTRWRPAGCSAAPAWSGVPCAQGRHQKVRIVEEQDVVSAVLPGHRQDVLPPLTHGDPWGHGGTPAGLA